ncbi:MAG: glucose-6-phosphate isomerase [Ruthenibacterium sp.]
MSVVLNTKHVNKFMDAAELSTIFPQVKLAHELLESRQGPGNEFLGWMDLPVAYDKAEFARIKQAAAKIRSDSEVLVVIGIGGSYLGARAAIEALKGTLYNSTCKGTPQIFYVGNSIRATNLQDVLAICEGRDVSVNIISKSGTTTEPAVAFRVFKALLEKKYGKDGARGRIYATTDKARGTLKELADREGYESFVVPDDVGGRYSVLTAVGLLPIAAAGCDIDALMAGAAEAREKLAVCDENNDCYRYAAMRNILYRKGKSVELMACYEPNFTMMNEWYKQLFGESEGKNQKGLFPASVIFSTDLHSMGQFVQDGARIMFETVVDIKKPQKDMFIEKSEENFDGLNFLSGQNMSIVNRKAMEGTILAHTDGGVPTLLLELDSLCEKDLGYLIYFFEKACAVSGYLLSVNPFDQPGVESYKKNMFALLGKPGYEAQRAELEAKLQ